MPLTPCPDCARHVRFEEPACPFCGRPAPFPAPARPRLPGRLGRAAIFAFRAAVIGAAGATTACGSATGLEDPDRAADAAPIVDPGLDGGGSIALYGGPSVHPPADAGAADAGGSIALYGGPGIELDAGGPDDGGVQALYGGPSPVPLPTDAGAEDAGGFVSLYGGAPTA